MLYILRIVRRKNEKQKFETVMLCIDIIFIV